MTSKLELTRTIDQVIVDYTERLKENLVNLNTWTATTHLAEHIADAVTAPEDKNYETAKTAEDSPSCGCSPADPLFDIRDQMLKFQEEMRARYKAMAEKQAEADRRIVDLENHCAKSAKQDVQAARGIEQIQSHLARQDQALIAMGHAQSDWLGVKVVSILGDNA